MERSFSNVNSNEPTCNIEIDRWLFILRLWDMLQGLVGFAVEACSAEELEEYIQSSAVVAVDTLLHQVPHQHQLSLGRLEGMIGASSIVVSVTHWSSGGLWVAVHLVSPCGEQGSKQ